METDQDPQLAIPIAPVDTDELCHIVRDSDTIVPGKSVVLSNFQNVVEYLPDEYTITVEAGARLDKVQALLAEENQYLPFDPPFADKGATIGGAVATGLSGPSGFRYGILRDFIIGVTLVDGLGNLIHGGGKVVKNAAGFDLPKFIAGSAGSCGFITEVTFKVFPKAPAFRTANFDFDSIESAVSNLQTLSSSQFTMEALELCQGNRLQVRLGGIQEALSSRISGIEKLIGCAASEIIEDDEAVWHDLTNFKDLPADGALIKLPIRPSDIPDLENRHKISNSKIRYGLGGSVAWIQCDGDLSPLSESLKREGLTAQVFRGENSGMLIGSNRNKTFYQRIKTALDPESKYPDLYL